MYIFKKRLAFAGGITAIMPYIRAGLVTVVWVPIEHKIENGIYGDPIQEVYMHACMNVFVYLCVRACMDICVCICMFV